MERRRRAALIVGATAAVSLVVWLFTSHAVTLWREHAAFLGFVLRSYAADPVLHRIPFLVPIGRFDTMASLLGMSATIVAGIRVARTMRGAPQAASLGWLSAMGVGVIPPLLIALVRWPDGQGAFTTPVIAGMQLLGASLVILMIHRVVPASPWQDTGETADRNASDASLVVAPWMVWVLSGIAVVFWLIVLLAGFSALQGYDSFSDHVARPARWLVTHRLETGVDGEVVTYYPGNFELLVRWLLTMGSDRFAFLASYVSSVAALWVVYRLAREIGQSVTAARMSALAAASLQVLAYQSIVVYSDTFTALCLLLATWVLLLWVRGGAQDRHLSLAFGLALGLAMGAKYSAGPPAFVLTVFWAWYASRGVPRDDFEQPLIDVRSLLRQSVWYTAGILPGMIFWYLRNAVRDGNPIYPLSVAGLPGIPLGDLLAGAPGPRTFWERLVYPWTETGHIAGFETGLGATVAAVVVLAVLLAPWTGRGSRLHRLLLLVFAASLLAWVRTGVLVPRYGLFSILLSFVFVGSLLTTFPSRILQGVTALAIVGTMAGLGFELSGGAAYNMLFHNAQAPVPAVIDSLPPSRILNLAAQPSGYYAMGADYRHRVLTPFRHFTPEDVKRQGYEYLLVLESEEAQYTQVLPMHLVERWSRPNWPSTSLWRLD